MRASGFIILFALNGIIFALIQEFRWKFKFISNDSKCELKKTSKRIILEPTLWDALVSVLMNLVAILTVMGMLIVYTQLVSYRPSSNVAFGGFIIFAISYKTFTKLKVRAKR
ncbi:MAG: hypothetical protein FD189_1491 [Elusimicrobia bacterium]|nr:MAG: hypothetical protein FD154_1708 [Elusimicrobiota bacterium]KAF0155158.1 MAG: hypothetical protein FD189_1491 [Elusimicrobiota bacterium]